MTFYKVLAEKENGKDTVTAYEKQDKYSTLKQYTILVSRDGISLYEIQTARTTWKKKFNEITK